MNRDDLITFLLEQGCVLVRNDKMGYSVIRNLINFKISGVPKEKEMLPATVCRICKTLDLEPPDGVKDAKLIVDIAHKNHSKQE